MAGPAAGELLPAARMQQNGPARLLRGLAGKAAKRSVLRGRKEMVSFGCEALGAPAERGRGAHARVPQQGLLPQAGKFMQVHEKKVRASLLGPAQAPAKWGGTASKGPQGRRPAFAAAGLQQPL